MATRLKRRLRQAAEEKRGILFGFLPAGFPTPDAFVSTVRAAFEAGLDALEATMPGPAPELDGPLIRDAALQAHEYLSTIPEALRLAAASRSSDDDTIIAMAYARHFGDLTPSAFLAMLDDADVDAYLVPEMPMSEQLEMGHEAQEMGIEPVIFLHLEEDLERLAHSNLDEPVIYLQSADLRTGGTFNPARTAERLSELRAAMGKRSYRVCVGFGVRGFDEAVALMETGADGIIIGTRVVQAAAISTEDVIQIIDEVAPALVRREELLSG